MWQARRCSTGAELHSAKEWPVAAAARWPSSVGVRYKEDLSSARRFWRCGCRRWTRLWRSGRSCAHIPRSARLALQYYGPSHAAGCAPLQWSLWDLGLKNEASLNTYGRMVWVLLNNSGSVRPSWDRRCIFSVSSTLGSEICWRGNEGTLSTRWQVVAVGVA